VVGFLPFGIPVTRDHAAARACFIFTSPARVPPGLEETYIPIRWYLVQERSTLLLERMNVVPPLEQGLKEKA
jgi:hypothetical protein